MAKSRKITDETQVKVFNNTTGEMSFKNKDHEEWLWRNNGDELEIPVKELKKIKQYGWLRYFEEQWMGFYPEDEDVLKHLNLGKYYENIVTKDEIDAYFDLDDVEFEKVLNQLAAEKKENAISMVIDKAKLKYADKELTNTHIINFLQTKFNISIES